MRKSATKMSRAPRQEAARRLPPRRALQLIADLIAPEPLKLHGDVIEMLKIWHGDAAHFLEHSELTLKQAALPGLPPPVTKTNAALAKLSLTSGAGTNTASTTASAASGENNLDDPEAEKPAAQDAPLAETEHILLDYLSLVPKGNLVTAGH